MDCSAVMAGMELSVSMFLMCRKQICELQEEAMVACHEGAHAGRKSAKLVQQSFFWPNLYADVCRYVAVATRA